jgi:hypothetical protein
MQTAFDYEIKSGEPKSLDAENKNWEIPLVVTATTNKNIDFCANYCIKTLSALSLSLEEVTSYESLNKAVFPVMIHYNGLDKTFYLRKRCSIKALNTLTSQWAFYTRLFTVQSGTDDLYGNMEVRISELKSGYEIENNEISIKFLTAGKEAATFSWQDKRTLAQIEKITGYKVEPLGVVRQYKHGGIVAYEENGHGFVAAIADLDQQDWNAAKTSCDELILGGYSDWRLPTKDELNRLYINLNEKGAGGFLNTGECYWSSTEDKDRDLAWGQYFSVYEQEKNGSQKKSKNTKNFVRPVRAF